MLARRFIAHVAQNVASTRRTPARQAKRSHRRAASTGPCAIRRAIAHPRPVGAVRQTRRRVCAGRSIRRRPRPDWSARLGAAHPANAPIGRSRNSRLTNQSVRLTFCPWPAVASAIMPGKPIAPFRTPAICCPDLTHSVGVAFQPGTFPPVSGNVDQDSGVFVVHPKIVSSCDTLDTYRGSCCRPRTSSPLWQASGNIIDIELNLIFNHLARAYSEPKIGSDAYKFGMKVAFADR